MHDALFKHWLEGAADAPEAMNCILLAQPRMLGDQLDYYLFTLLRLPCWQNSITI
jgi:hypothetical protein